MSQHRDENLFASVPFGLPEELISILAQNSHIRIERIVSSGHASPEGFWYDQPEHEWVILLQGSAELLLDGDKKSRQMLPGSYLLIPAHQKHRVESTSRTEATVWLAVFFSAKG
ncbi:MAG: cupin domain-containing protein [Planctomycetia bacterium]